jgi:peptidoglycan/xylan/chitin deacetylase (PgdA/CDA1 family)
MVEFVPARGPPIDEVRGAGMDHALYPFRALPDAPRFAWPHGARIAFTITLVLDHWELAPPEGDSPDPRIVSPLGKFFPDWLTWSHRLYGPRVGIFRILEVLDRFDLKLSVALGTEAAKRYPELIDALSRRDACFMAHGHYATRRITSRMDDERGFIALARDAVAAAVGQAPAGWCGQDFNESEDTPALLAEAGFQYTTDWANDDRPYLLGPGRLLALPPQPEWNDLECMWLRHVAPAIWSGIVVEAFNVLHAEGGAVFNLTLHPWITGQAHRIRYLRDALHGILGKPHVWCTTTDALAAEARQQLGQT